MSSIFFVCMCDYSLWISIIWYLICNMLLWYHDYHLEFYLHPISQRMQQRNHSFERKMLKNFINHEASKRLRGVEVLIVWLCIEVACLWKLAWELIDRKWSLEKYYGISQTSIDPRSSNKRKKKKKKNKEQAQGSEHQLLGRKRKKQELKELLS